jgi:hypothetical protein
MGRTVDHEAAGIGQTPNERTRAPAAAAMYWRCAAGAFIGAIPSGVVLSVWQVPRSSEPESQAVS